MANERLAKIHHCFVVAVGLVCLEHGKFRIVTARDALIAEDAAHFKDTIHPAHKEAFEREL